MVCQPPSVSGDHLGVDTEPGSGGGGLAPNSLTHGVRLLPSAQREVGSLYEQILEQARRFLHRLGYAETTHQLRRGLATRLYPTLRDVQFTHQMLRRVSLGDVGPAPEVLADAGRVGDRRHRRGVIR